MHLGFMSVRHAYQILNIYLCFHVWHFDYSIQCMFVLYHYWKAAETYNAIRCFIAAYVWMTGFGNFMYFQKFNDFSVVRMFRMLFRLNFLVFFICWTVNTVCNCGTLSIYLFITSSLMSHRLLLSRLTVSYFCYLLLLLYSHPIDRSTCCTIFALCTLCGSWSYISSCWRSTPRIKILNGCTANSLHSLSLFSFFGMSQVLARPFLLCFILFLGTKDLCMNGCSAPVWITMRHFSAC